MMNMRRILPLLLLLLMIAAGCTTTGSGTARRGVASPRFGTSGVGQGAPEQVKTSERFFIEIGIAGSNSPDDQPHRGDISGGSVFDDSTLARLKREVLIRPFKWKRHYNLGLFYMSRGDFDRAEKSLHKAMEFKGTPSLIYNALGTLYESMGNQEKALDFFKSALDVKKTPLAMMNIANTFMRMGALEKAEKYYLMIDETDSSLTPIFNYNIAIFFYKTEKYDEALKRIDRAISGGREDYLVRYTKASILVKLNRFTEALEIFGSLKHERPGDARLYKNMGVIYELYTRDMARALQNYVGYIGIVGQSNAGAVQQWADVVRAIISRQGGSATGGGSDE